jgi:hypothetical protein
MPDERKSNHQEVLANAQAAIGKAEAVRIRIAELAQECRKRLAKLEEINRRFQTENRKP